MDWLISFCSSCRKKNENMKNLLSLFSTFLLHFQTFSLLCFFFFFSLNLEDNIVPVPLLAFGLLDQYPQISSLSIDALKLISTNSKIGSISFEAKKHFIFLESIKESKEERLKLKLNSAKNIIRVS